MTSMIFHRPHQQASVVPTRPAGYLSCPAADPDPDPQSVRQMLNYLLILFGISVFGGYLLNFISVPIQYPIALIAENQYLGFFIPGLCALSSGNPHPNRNISAALFTVSVLLVTAGTCWKSFTHNAHKDVYFQYRNPLLVLAAACVFLILLRLPKNGVPRVWEKFVHHVADNSFGIYIFHAVF